MFLHEHPKFKELIDTVAFERRVQSTIVEKDYWVMHTLWGLAQCGFVYYFKGGTSLSKGFNIIKRFSEDLDLQIDPPDHLNVYVGKNHQKSKHRESRKVFFGWVVEQLKIQGLSVGFHRATESKIRNYTIALNYRSLFERDEIIKRHVLLEVGFARVFPNEARDISSWIFDRAAVAELAVTDNRAKAVKVYKPEYTFIEKLDAIHQKYSSDKPPRYWVRHYYDVYMLLQLDRVQSFIGTEPCKEYMNERFQTDAGDVAKLPAFQLKDSGRFAVLKSAHEAELGLYFEPQPSFDEIAALLRTQICKC